MADDLDGERQLLYRLMAENRRHAERSEDRRILITSVTALTTSAILIAITITPLTPEKLLLALWTAILGVFGVFSCLKLYERARFHELRARHLRHRLVELSPGAQAEQLQKSAEDAHGRNSPWLSALHFNTILVSLNLLTTVLAIVYLGVVLVGLRTHA